MNIFKILLKPHPLAMITRKIANVKFFISNIEIFILTFRKSYGKIQIDNKAREATKMKRCKARWEREYSNDPWSKSVKVYIEEV